MNLIEAIKERHSVRHYTSQAIEPEKIEHLQQLVQEYNSQSGLHIQLITNEPRSFGESLLARYGKFSGVTTKLVLKAQTMGLNTCWVGLSYKKISSVLDIASDEKLVCLISVGYGATQGVDHKRKSPNKVSAIDIKTAPQWYKQGVACALLAPTAINQQKFKFDLKPGNRVSVKAGIGPYAKVDLGIVKYHFEIGAGKKNFVWV